MHHTKISSPDERYAAYRIFFGTLVSEPRLLILNTLRDQELSVNDLSEATEIEQTALSHHLRKLKHCGFVSCRTDGKFRYYKVEQKTIGPLLTLIDQHMETNCIHILRDIHEEDR